MKRHDLISFSTGDFYNFSFFCEMSFKPIVFIFYLTFTTDFAQIPSITQKNGEEIGDEKVKNA